MTHPQQRLFRPSLRLLALFIPLLFPLLAAAQTPPTRIMPLGDSITDEVGAAGGYRDPLYALLTAAGYNVDYVGLQTGNPSPTLPDPDHQGIPGWRIDQVDSDISKWFGVVANPDVILLHIGTNDFGQNLDTPNAINRLDDLVTKLATLLPNAHVVVTNLMVRGEPYNTTIQQQFNPYVQGKVAAQQALGRNVTFLDMRSAVPLSDMPDQLHPDQAGYDKMASAWFPAIQSALGMGPPTLFGAAGSADLTHVTIAFSKPVAASATAVENYAISGGLTVFAASLDASQRVVTLTTGLQVMDTQYTVTVNGVTDQSSPDPLPLAPNSTVSFFPPHPRGYLANVPESVGYTLAYSLDIPAAADFNLNSVPYTVDNHNGIGTFSRIAYYLELQQPDGDLQFLWASMDAFTGDIGQIAVPTGASGAIFQQNVTNMNVVSNAAGIVTGSGLTGNLEFWPTDYSQQNAAGVPGADNTTYDFGDSRTPSGNYGSMQLHNAAALQTLFAFNNWGGNANAGDVDLGIGNDPAPINGGVDWTFSNNAAGYSVKTLQVLVQTTGDVTPPSLVSAVSSFGGTTLTVTFSEPLAAGSVQASDFSLNGVIVLGASLAANQHDVILLTTTQPAGVPLTLTVSGVRDSSPSANLIAPASAIAVSAPVLPPEIVANVGASAAGYQLVASLDLPVTGNLNASDAAYVADDRAASGPFSRVAYYLELQSPGGPVQYVWAAMDAFTNDRKKLSLPTAASGAMFQQNVTNLDVISNVSGVVNGTGLGGGNIEFWPGNYTAANGAGVPNASDDTYDFGDTPSGGVGYGCMQIHNHDASAAQTVLAINDFGTDGATLDLGIGNDPAPVNGGVDWTFAANAGAYTLRVLHILVLPMAPPPLPAAVVANVPQSAGYQLAYALSIPASGNSASLVYSVNNGANVGPFSRVAYYLELQTGTDTPDFVWTAMDAFTTNGALLGVPTAASGAFFQQNVTNLDVLSNVPGIVNGMTAAGGNIEFWPSNYTPSNDAGVPNADSSTFDFGDGGADTSEGYGSMQVHNHDPGAEQTLFAFNHFGSSTGDSPFCLGIGNDPAPVNGGVDWTFAENAANYSSRTLYVMILPGSSVLAAPAIVRATGSPALNRLVVTFNKPVADTAADPANFDIPGLSVTGATLLAGQQDVALATSAQIPGGVYTVNVTGVRDRSETGNLILPGASATFTAFTPPPVFANVPEISGYNLVYQIAIPVASPQWNLNPIPYSIDESRFGEQLFDRVAYLLELDGNWVYASFDRFTNTISQVGVPTIGVTATPFQQDVTNLNVASNVPGVVTGTGLTGGNIEYWSGDYTEGNALGIPNASDTVFDFGDTMTPGGHGSMQVHNHDASQTLFAYNNWGSNAGQTSAVGIGNNPNAGSAGQGGTQGLDWTFAGNAANYGVRNLYVLVRPGGSASGPAPALLSQPPSRLLNPGGSTTLAVTVNGSGPFTYQWRFNGVAISGATNSWLDLNSVGFGQAGSYDVVVTGADLVSTASEPAVVTVNHPPVFAGFSFTAQKDQPVLLASAALLGKAADLDGDALMLTSVSPASAQAGAVSLGAGGATYAPAPGFLGTDSFTISIADGKGGSVIGTVNATVTSAAINPAGQSSLAIRADGKVDLLFFGTPGQSYAVQRSVDLGNPLGWSTLVMAAAGDDGLIPFTDLTPPAGDAFYRTLVTFP